MEGFLLQLGSMSIQAVIVILTVLLVRVAFAGAKVPKKYVTWLWMVPYIIMICPWKISSVFSFWRMPKQYQADRIQAGTDKMQQTVTQMVTGALSGGGISDNGDVVISGEAVLNQATGVIGNELVHNMPGSGEVAANTWSVTEIFGLVWLFGVATLLIYSVVSYIKLQRKVLCSMQVENNIYRADDISTAFVLGVIRPKIYIPSALHGENLSYVLEHEKTHIKRFDPLKKICTFGITSVHWFNPFAWVAFYFFCKDMEMACDEETVARIGMEKKQEYAMALLQLSSAKKMIAGAPLAFGEDNVKDRVRNIAKFKKVWMLVSVVAVIVVIVLAVGFLSKYENDETQEPVSETVGENNGNEQEEPGSNPSVGEDLQNNLPEATEEPIEETEEGETTEEFTDEWSQTYLWEDLDGDGIEEYVLIERGDFQGQNSVNGRLTVFVNDEPVYQYTEELWIVGVNAMEYLDLDGDGKEEIFVSFMPAVNSAGLEEWFVLKKVGNSWEMLEMYHYKDDMRDNAFPITVVLKEKDFDFVIRCEGWDGEIAFDAKSHYERRKAEQDEGNGAYAAFMDGPYVEGSVVGSPLAWGIWNIQAGTYENDSCLIAEHGLGGPWGKYDYYGNAYVYFNYDEHGKINILYMEFTPSEY